MTGCLVWWRNLDTTRYKGKNIWKREKVFLFIRKRKVTGKKIRNTLILNFWLAFETVKTKSTWLFWVMQYVTVLGSQRMLKHNKPKGKKRRHREGSRQKGADSLGEKGNTLGGGTDAAAVLWSAWQNSSQQNTKEGASSSQACFKPAHFFWSIQHSKE